LKLCCIVYLIFPGAIYHSCVRDSLMRVLGLENKEVTYTAVTHWSQHCIVLPVFMWFYHFLYISSYM